MKAPLLLVLAASLFCSCAGRSDPARTLRPSARIDLDRYMGDWFVVANIPYWAEKDCYGSIERYLLLPDGRIKTTFLARKGGFDGRAFTAKSTARVTNPANNAEWEVAFFGGLAKVPLVILSTAPDYRYAVVATPDRRKAWILSRTKTLTDPDAAAAFAVLRNNGISPDLLQKVPQQD